MFSSHWFPLIPLTFGCWAWVNLAIWVVFKLIIFETSYLYRNTKTYKNQRNSSYAKSLGNQQFAKFEKRRDSMKVGKINIYKKPSCLFNYCSVRMGYKPMRLHSLSTPPSLTMVEETINTLIIHHGKLWSWRK